MSNCPSCNPQINPATPCAQTETKIEPVLFMKVTIPTAMGDETQVPATAGKYRNVLLQYEINDHVYIYSSDGIPTFIKSNGSFEDLTNRPLYGGQIMTGDTNIPTVNDSKITITKNGSTAGDFTVNQSGDKTVDITVPTKTSDLTNDSNFPVDANYVHTDNNYTTAEKTKLSDTIEIDTIGANLTYNSSTKTLSANAQSAILYDATGQNEDGAMTQKATTDALATKATTAQVAELQSEIPTKTSDLTNDSNFAVDANYVHTDNNYTNTDKTAVANLNQGIGYDLTVTADTSTATITEYKANLYNGTTSTEALAMPVANATQAGVMNALTYQAVQTNAMNINAILGGAVSISGLSASPTQSELTTAWQTATSISTVINGAKINDSDNSKVWTYYTNTATWYPATNTAQVVVNDASNTTKGIVLGSATGDGTIFVEADTTMSVNGWDTLTASVAANTANLALKANSADLATVATSGSYNDLSNLPTIPTTTSQLTNNSNFVSDANYTHTDNNYTSPEKTKLAGIATGAEVNVQSNWTETDTSSDAYIQNKPTLATVATSGSYADLSNKPTIPTVNDATLTIQQNGTSVGTFTANSSTNVTANITVPVITMTTTDPGEGVALAANHFIAVY